MTDRLLRIDEVVGRVGLGRTRIHQLERAGQFPARRQLGGRSVAWLESELVGWMHELPAGIDPSRQTGAVRRDDAA